MSDTVTDILKQAKLQLELQPLFAPKLKLPLGKIETGEYIKFDCEGDNLYVADYVSKVDTFKQTPEEKAIEKVKAGAAFNEIKKWSLSLDETAKIKILPVEEKPDKYLHYYPKTTHNTSKWVNLEEIPACPIAPKPKHAPGVAAATPVLAGSMVKHKKKLEFHHVENESMTKCGLALTVKTFDYLSEADCVTTKSHFGKYVCVTCKTSI